MNASFIVTVELESFGASDLEGVANALADAAEASGLVVIEAKPWSRPVTAPGLGSTSIGVPPLSPL